MLRRIDPADIVRTSLDEYYAADLMRLAADWHGGQSSALYAFTSTGSVIPGLGAEARRCAEYPQARTLRDGQDEQDMLHAIASLDTQ